MLLVLLVNAYCNQKQHTSVLIAVKTGEGVGGTSPDRINGSITTIVFTLFLLSVLISFRRASFRPQRQRDLFAASQPRFRIFGT